MITIESTPKMAAGIYEIMARNLDVARRRLGRPLTLADKVLLGHLDYPKNQELEVGKSYLLLRPDRVVFQDVIKGIGNSPNEFAAAIKSEIPKWAKAIKEAGIKAD